MRTDIQSDCAPAESENKELASGMPESLRQAAESLKYGSG